MGFLHHYKVTARTTNCKVSIFDHPGIKLNIIQMAPLYQPCDELLTCQGGALPLPNGSTF